jgi:membrane-associated protease RseP (regulator of RpoE activity)
MMGKKRAWHIAAVISVVVLVTLGAAACATAYASSDEGESAQSVAKKAAPWPGMDVSADAKEVAVPWRLEMDVVADAKGVYVTNVQRYSAAALLGLQPGDLITSMNDTPVLNMADYNRVLQELCGEGFWAEYSRKDRKFETLWIDRVR